MIVLPYNDEHKMGGVQEADCVSVGELIDPPPWERMPMIRHGQGGSPTSVVCGYLSCDDPLFDPRLRMFPPAFAGQPAAGTRAGLGAGQHRLRRAADHAGLVAPL